LKDHRVDKATGAVLPHRVELHWPKNNMSMAMKFGEIQVNPIKIPSRIWEMPNANHNQIVHLDAGVAYDPTATALRDDLPVRLGELETIQSHDDANFLRDDLPMHGDDERPGRATLSSATDEEELDEDWTK
jgi:hypothetical protein